MELFFLGLWVGALLGHILDTWADRVNHDRAAAGSATPEVECLRVAPSQSTKREGEPCKDCNGTGGSVNYDSAGSWHEPCSTCRGTGSAIPQEDTDG
jgi:hypothetical protein